MKQILTFAAAATLLCSCGSKTAYVVKGSVEGLDGTVYLFNSENQLIDSTTVEQGAFRFTGDATTPDFHFVTSNRDQRMRSFGLLAHFIVEPGTITISGDMADPNSQTVTGTPANDALSAFNTASVALMTEYQNPETTDERRKAIIEEYNALMRSSYEANRTNYFGASQLKMLSGELFSAQETLEEIAGLAPELQALPLVADLKAQCEQRLKSEVGQPYIDIVQKDADGKEVSLKSVVENPANKYVLLDFWASWCGPCMGEVPYLTADYAKYHKKGFEIYGVSFDSKRENWIDAYTNHKMNWIHVSDVNGWDNQARNDYAVNSIPSNFLIDCATGKIIATQLRGEALGQKLEELLGK